MCIFQQSANTGVSHRVPTLRKYFFCDSPVQEAFWSCSLTPHLHLYFTAAVLIHHRRAILENPDNHPFDGLLRFCIQLSGRLDLDQLLRLAEALCALAGQAGRECLEGV